MGLFPGLEGQAAHVQVCQCRVPLLDWDDWAGNHLRANAHISVRAKQLGRQTCPIINVSVDKVSKSLGNTCWTRCPTVFLKPLIVGNGTTPKISCGHAQTPFYIRRVGQLGHFEPANHRQGPDAGAGEAGAVEAAAAAEGAATAIWCWVESMVCQAWHAT